MQVSRSVAVIAPSRAREADEIVDALDRAFPIAEPRLAIEFRARTPRAVVAIELQHNSIQVAIEGDRQLAG